MRLRNIPGARETVAESIHCITEPNALRGQWHTFLENENPIHLEIGMGKGKFLMELAELHPEINYIGIEMYASVLLRAVQKMDEHPLANVHFLNVDASLLPDYFAPGEVDRIYLNFSDPWPKERHAKRRLTSHQFLKKYTQILVSGGQLEFKTDNQGLFAFSLEEIENAADWKLEASTWDLHHDAAMNEGNIMTEYEEKFSEKGNPICKLTARYLPDMETTQPDEKQTY